MKHNAPIRLTETKVANQTVLAKTVDITHYADIDARKSTKPMAVINKESKNRKKATYQNNEPLILTKHIIQHDGSKPKKASNFNISLNFYIFFNLDMNLWHTTQ
jgi:hypothetical protein